MNRRGSSLLENLLAVSLLATALLTVLGVFIGGLQLIQRSQKVTIATGAAREIIERSKGMIGNLPGGTSTFDGRMNPAPPAVAGFPPAPYPRLIQGDLSMPIVVSTRRSGDKTTIEVQVFYTPTNAVQLVTNLVP